MSCLNNGSAYSVVSLLSWSAYTHLIYQSLSEKQTWACHSCLKYLLAYVASKMVATTLHSPVRRLTVFSSHMALVCPLQMPVPLFTFFSQEIPSFWSAFCPSPIHLSRMVMFVRTWPGIGSRMLNRQITSLTSGSSHSFSTWHPPTHSFRLVSDVISTLEFFPRACKQMCSLCRPSLYLLHLFISVTAFRVFIKIPVACCVQNLC